MRKRLFAWILLAISLIGWPLTSLTVAKDEPQVVLALSWIAIILTALDGLWVAELHEEEED